MLSGQAGRSESAMTSAPSPASAPRDLLERVDRRRVAGHRDRDRHADDQRRLPRPASQTTARPGSEGSGVTPLPYRASAPRTSCQFARSSASANPSTIPATSPIRSDCWSTDDLSESAVAAGTTSCSRFSGGGATVAPTTRAPTERAFSSAVRRSTRARSAAREFGLLRAIRSSRVLARSAAACARR